MASSAAAAAGKFGKLWGRGHESFSPSLRRILSVKGKGATTYLQGLVTCDLLSEPTPPREEYIEEDNESSDDVPKVEFSSRMRSACFLDQRGRIVTDALLWKLQKDHQDDNGNDNDEEEYLIDVPGNAADDLLSHLNQYKLRRTKVSIKDKSDNISAHVVYGTLNAQGSPPGYLAAIDPRHPSLGMRILSMPEDKTTTPEQRKADFEKLMSSMFPSSNGTYEAIRKLAGVAEGVDVKGKTALECNQEFLNAISFQKGCYLGQELTARTHFTGVIRKRIMPIILTDTQTEVPQPWIMASKMQEQNREKVKDLLPQEVEDSLPAKLPNLSAPMVGGLISLVTGTVQMPLPSEEKNNKGDETLEDNAVDSDELAAKAQSDELKILQDAGEALFEEIFSAAKKGSKLIDTSDGKTIGQILAAPVPGLPVVLAQMRLDRVGLLESKKGGWSRMNRIRIGESKKEFRYLPYTPNWWPALDEKTGKEKKIDESPSNPQE